MFVGIICIIIAVIIVALDMKVLCFSPTISVGVLAFTTVSIVLNQQLIGAFKVYF